jgi:hypothetical protein
VTRTGGATVAFESVDGPPRNVFEQLVTTLSEEAQARQMPVVSRQATAAYRVRTYLAVHILRKQPRVGWVWDVYDSDRRRLLRISGEEPGGRLGRDGWAAANGDVLRRIARKGMDRLAAFVGAPDTPPRLPVAPSDEDGTVLAAAPSASHAAGEPAANVPLPPRRPQRAATMLAPSFGAVSLAIAAR